MDELRYLSILVVVAPLLGAVITGLLGRYINKLIVNWLTCGLIAVSFLGSSYLLYGYLTGQYQTWDQTIYVWGTSGSLEMTVGFLLDRLSVLMMTVVSFVSLMVHVYSIGYMADDPGYKRFFCYISLFTFAMLMLVMANNFVQLFFGWEGVGLMSYLLIGFWYKKPSAIFANLKAFLVNRVGDLGFILGIAGILYYFNSLHYTSVFAHLPDFIAQKNAMFIFNQPWAPITVICICLFIGAMAKSAQVPLHVWLPDSMEGPTPISALIHAATMVTAGVFMVARMSPLFEYSETALSFILVIGSITCFFMGILAVVQTDIKRIIAYSTLSQLGYMVVALGVSAYAAGIFHLTTHAFFKALLFLGAGSAIMAMHHDQDIFRMGGLCKSMRITAITMLIGTLSLVGFPGMAGFYSKDLIIAAAHNSTIPGAHLAYYVTLFSVFVTSLYSFRLLFVVFCGEQRMEPEVKAHIHESPSVVWVPLVLLAIPSIFIGGLMINSVLHDFFQQTIYVAPQHDVLAEFTQHEYHGVWGMLMHGFISWPFFWLLSGALTAWYCYIRNPSLPIKIQHHTNALGKILNAKYGFDWFNENIIVPSTRYIGNALWHYGDMRLIDSAMVDGAARRVSSTAMILRKIQTGYLYNYIFLMIAGMVVLLVGIIWL